jgi:hypothetical protein
MSWFSLEQLPGIGALVYIIDFVIGFALGFNGVTGLK